MPGLTDFLENKVIDHTLGTANYVKPTAVYLALYTASPTDTTAGAEVTGAGYARQAITFNAAVSGVATSSIGLTFTSAGASWGTVVAVGILDAASSGNLLWFGPLTTTRTIGTTDALTFAAGAISVSLD